MDNSSGKSPAVEDCSEEIVLPRNWVDVSGTTLDKRFCIVTYQQVKDSPPLVVTRSLVIDGTHHTWQVHVKQ